MTAEYSKFALFPLSYCLPKLVGWNMMKDPSSIVDTKYLNICWQAHFNRWPFTAVLKTVQTIAQVGSKRLPNWRKNFSNGTIFKTNL